MPVATGVKTVPERVTVGTAVELASQPLGTAGFYRVHRCELGW
jgi:hypothetical protein